MLKQLEKLTTKIEKMVPFSRKKVIEDWDFIMVFEQYYRGEVQLMFTSLKCQQDLTWKIVDNPQAKTVLILLKLSDEIVIDMAHQLKILKKKDKQSFKLKLKDINNLIYTTDKQKDAGQYNYLCFIKSRLAKQNIEIYQQEKYSLFNKSKKQKYFPDAHGKIFTQEEQLRAKYHFIVTYQQNIEYDKKSNHQIATVRQPFSTMIKHPGFKQFIPIQKVSQHRLLILNNNSLKDYLGPNIDCYFSFVNFMQKWLVFPMIIGLISFILNSYYNYTADNSPFDFIYAFFIMIWSILFITRWQQIEKWNKIKHRCGTSELWTEYQHIIKTQNLQRHYSLVTGQIQCYMSLKMKILLFATSYSICLVMMIVTLAFIVYSLNARGFIDPQHKLFYSERVSMWAKEGGIFDRNTNYGQIPNIIHVIVTNAFDENIFRPIVKKLTKFQRHRNRKNYQNSVIIKYFIYQFVITFADLFYIAFIRLDIEGLKKQLLSLFFIGIVRRIVSESLIPFMLKKRRAKNLQHLKENSQQAQESQLRMSYYSNKMSTEDELKYGAILQVNKATYQPFDDYLEIISNFGFLVMLSSCFPLAPLLIIVAHGVQVIQDKYKIIHILKRKLPQSYVGMGSWKNIIVFLCYISIVTNILLFAFSSQQVVNFFPKMYEGGKDLLYGETTITTLIGDAACGLMQSVLPTQNDTKIQNQFVPLLQQYRSPDKQFEGSFVLILFIIEHFFLLLFVLIRSILQKKISQAERFLDRRQYKRRIKKNIKKNILDSMINELIRNQQLAKSGKSKLITEQTSTQQDGDQNGKIVGNLFMQFGALIKKQGIDQIKIQ